MYLLCHRVKNNLLGEKKRDSNRGGKLNPTILGVDKVGKTVLSYTLVETETSTDFEEKLQSLPNVKKFLIYGAEDDEYDTVFPTLRDKKIDNLKMIEIEGADHRFTDMIPQFIQTIKK